MRVIVGADHRGFALKEGLKARLTEHGHTLEDVGAHTMDPMDDYPDFGVAVGRAVAQDSNARGIVICGSGVGVAIAANKIGGARAGTVATPEQARAVRADEDLNILALSADALDFDRALPIVTAFLTTPFSGEDRHVRRISKLHILDAHGTP